MSSSLTEATLEVLGFTPSELALLIGIPVQRLEEWREVDVFPGDPMWALLSALRALPRTVPEVIVAARIESVRVPEEREALLGLVRKIHGHT